MARTASVAVAGFYPTPIALVPILATHLGMGEGPHAYLDPCAGDGEAVVKLAESLAPENKGYSRQNHRVYAIEMEKTRHEKLETRLSAYQGYSHKEPALHGDAFCAEIQRGDRHEGVSVLYLNPPYDLDPVTGRLEERFLRRFTDTLNIGGALVFLVPFYALKASAETLARRYDNLSCFRFPGELFSAFKQVALFATRCVDREVADPDLEAQVRGWAADADSIPELGLPESPVVNVRPMGEYRSGFESFRMTPVDMPNLLKAFQPWTVTSRGGVASRVEGVVPTVQVADLLDRTYPLAMPPKAAHIATGVAAGIFNGAVIEPDDKTLGLPPLLIKGCFDKEWRKVEEKTNKKGEVTSEVQVQAPKLVVTVLDLSTKKYHTLGSSTEPTMTRTIETMTTADLLASYGGDLMKVLLRQCPVSYDPADPAQHFPLAAMKRPLYRAQEHVVRAAVMQLGGPSMPLKKRRHRSAFILGEIGSGKSIIGLATLATIGARSTLLLCPPHLLASWQEQVALSLPAATCTVLTTVDDVLAYVQGGGPEAGMRVAILSRETAKLGHAYRGVDGRCPACHGALDEKPEELAQKRLRCTHRTWSPVSRLSRLSVLWGEATYAVSKRHAHLLTGALRRRVDKGVTAEHKARALASLRESDLVLDAAAEVLDELRELHYGDRQKSMKVTATALGLVLSGPRLCRYIELLWAMGVSRTDDVCRELAVSLAMRLQGEEREAFLAFIEAVPYRSTHYSWQSAASSTKDILETGWSNLDAGVRPDSGMGSTGTMLRGWEKAEGWTLDKMAAGSESAAMKVYEGLRRDGQWSKGEVCGEPLFQAIPEPTRRTPLADFIAKRHPDAFDTLVLDEVQEYATEGSAQERAAHLLTEVGWPILMLTGTISNGYASSMFTNTWATNMAFRQEFDRNELSAFMDRYGYRKRVVQDKDKETGEVVAYGSHTDRVERSARMTGYAPGVLPLFVYRYLLNKACVIHKTDARGDIPPLTEERVQIEPEARQQSAYLSLQRELLAQIRKDQFQPDLAGKLFGAMSELPSYLDRCTSDAGNQDDGSYEIRYPEAIGGHLVSRGESFSAGEMLPKEQWLIDTVRAELAAGENVMVFAWHVNLFPRMKRLIEQHVGAEVVVLEPSKVPTAKRQAWIEKEVVKKGRRILLCNPTTVQTGLNNLVHFSRIVVFENPACNPIVYRQAIGRIDRIGQTRPTKVYFPIYRNTLQEAAHKLLLLKVAVSRSTDGLDAEGALQAAGVGDNDALTSMSVGRALAEWIRQREHDLTV